MEKRSLEVLENIEEGDIAVLTDFDGTITNIDILGYLFREFAESRFEYARQFAHGEIDMREEIRATFRTINVSKEILEKALDVIEIDPGFIEFLEFGREKGYTFAILSDGLEWYIRRLLDRYDINGIPIYANQIFFEENGFRFEFPWFDQESSRRGVCKSKIARAYRACHNAIVYVGDGRSDLDVIHEADILYSKGWLAGYCFAKGMGESEFYDWHDLIDKWHEPDFG